MIIDWQSGALVHQQEYYGVGFVINWPGTSSYAPYVAYDEELFSDVLFSEVLSGNAIMTEIQTEDVALTESVSKTGVL